MNLELVSKLCEKCISEGEILLGTKWLKERTGFIQTLNPVAYVDVEGFNKWKSNCTVLVNLLGGLSAPWSDSISGTKVNTLASTKVVLGALKSMKETIDNGYLLKIEDLVFAEAFSNLLEQAEYLFKSGYSLASGVLGRAVLEEKLRNLCKSNGIVINKNSPTLGDYNIELYKAKYYDKIEFKNIEYLISVGNNAAHNMPVQAGDVKKLLEGVFDILKKYN